LSEIRLPVGEQTDNITVDAPTDIPTSGERSSLITDKDIQKLSTVGRDVTELLKTQAGFSQIQGGLDNSSSSAEVVGAYSGLSSYVGNGATANGTSLLSDGANVTDPGGESTQTQVINMDMVAEVKIETSNFGADVAKGPTVITAVSKSGSANFHGSVHVFARAHQLNAEDWFLKFENLSNIPDRYLYPGFEIGGPILIPHTNFNHSRRLTFELGAEDYVQRNTYSYGNPTSSYIQALVPTANMRQGNFSQQELANYLGTSIDNIQANCTSSGTLSNYYHVCAQPNGGSFTGGIANPSSFDPGAVALINGEIPLPTGPTVNGYNYHALNLENPDLYQIHTKIDLAVNDNNKFYAVFNTQNNFTSSIPEQIYYSPSAGGSLNGGIDTPGKIESPLTSNTASTNYTHIFGPRATNEIFAAVSYVGDYFYSGNQNALEKSTIGYPYQGIFPNASSEYPQLGNYSVAGLPLAITPDFSNGQYVSKKFIPSGGDNYSLQVKAHTLKFGVYLERDTANQTDLSPITNGQITEYYVPTGSFTDAAGTHQTVNCNFTNCGANYLADFFQGDIDQFFQQNFNPKTNLNYWTVSWFGTDSWKITKKLTLDYGVRFDHLGPWTDAHGVGIAIFSPSLYATDIANGGTAATALPGVRWHGNDPSLPLSGAPSRFAFVSPRLGIAFDPFGTGRTMFRGGWGMYRAHDSWNDYSPSAATAQGLIIASVGGSGISLAGVDAGAAALGPPTNPAYYVCNSSGTTGCPSISALDPTDNQQPLTMTYSFSVSQQMPEKAVFDIAYVGNQSHHLLTDSVAQSIEADIQNVNAIPLGAMFKPDPNPLSTSFGMVLAPDSTNVSQTNDFRPFPHYTNLLVPRHLAYANYNALQASLNRQTGKLNFGLNYTFSKAQGVRGGYANGLTEDPTNFRADYGPLAFDRTNIAAASYSYDEGVIVHRGRFVSGLLNRWFISGITNLQSGPNLQAIYSPDLALTGTTAHSYNGAVCSSAAASGNACAIDSKTILGTPDIYLQPTIRPDPTNCPGGNPTGNLQKHQYINGFCFGLPAFGENGPSNLGYIRGPAFFNSDLTVQKTVPLSESKNLQFRLSAFNFLNHPITEFSSRFTNEASLQLTGDNFSDVSLQNKTNTNPAGGGCSAYGSTCFGYAGYKTGRRVLEVSGRFNF
jgi:hypothetical protein